MKEYRIFDGNVCNSSDVLFKSLDGSIFTKKSGALTSDCKTLSSRVSDELLHGTDKIYLEKALFALVEFDVPPSKLRRRYAAIYRIAKQCRQAVAEEKSKEMPSEQQV